MSTSNRWRVSFRKSVYELDFGEVRREKSLFLQLFVRQISASNICSERAAVGME